MKLHCTRTDKFDQVDHGWKIDHDLSCFFNHHLKIMFSYLCALRFSFHYAHGSGCIDKVCIYERIHHALSVTLPAVENWGELQWKGFCVVLIKFVAVAVFLFTLVIRFHTCVCKCAGFGQRISKSKSALSVERYLQSPSNHSSWTPDLLTYYCLCFTVFSFVSPLGTISCLHLRFNAYVAARLARKRGWTFLISSGKGRKSERSLDLSGNPYPP